MKKKIIICTASAIVTFAVVITALTLIYTNNVSGRVKKINTIISGLEQPAQVKSLLNDLFAAADSKGKPAAAESGDASENSGEIAYNITNIPPVTELKRLGGQEDSINLVWRETGGVNGYRVYRKTSGDEKDVYTLFSTVKRANLDIRNLEKGSKFDFKVVAFIADEHGTYEGKGAEASFATAPGTVEGFKLSDAGKDSVTLSWSKCSGADGYSLERCYGGKWSEYKTLGADATEFTDEDLEEDRAYFYRLSAFREDSDGKLKGDSKDVYTVAGLVAPEDTGSEARVGRISLDYSYVDYADGYKIYISDDKKKWNLLDDIDVTTYTAERPDENADCFFRVVPYKEVSYLEIAGPALELDFTAGSEEDEDIGDTYIEVSIDEQHMWYIKDGEIFLDSDVVTGNRNSADTPTGQYRILNKATSINLVGDDYVSYVEYWMPFIGGTYGLHDASWRSDFGGDIYDGDGSHGCVNLPSDIAEELYDDVKVGTPVIIY